MPFGLDTPVLTVDANVVRKVDTGNPQNLFCMWTVFSKCADSVEQGRRLENLSWRLWNSQQFLTETDQLPVVPSSTSLPRDIPSVVSITDVPSLSESVESVPDEQTPEFTSRSSPLEIRPRIVRQDSCASSRSRGRQSHLKSDEFEKMVVEIIEDRSKQPKPFPVSVRLASPPTVVVVKELREAFPERSGSTTTESSPTKTSDSNSDLSSQPASSPEMTSHTNVVRGFLPSPSKVAFTRPASQDQSRLSPNDIPASTSTAPRLTQRKNPMFRFGGSPSSSDQAQSLETRKPALKPSRRGPMFQPRASGSSEEGSLKSAFLPRNSLRPAQKKQATFTQVTIAEAAVDDQSESDDVDESAIDDDDDSSEWEDSIEDSGKSSIDEKTYFQRVNSGMLPPANLATRRSLITLALEQNQRARTLGNIASQSTSALPRPRAPPNGSSLAVSPNDSDEPPLMMKKGTRQTLKPINETSAQPIVAKPVQIHAQAALSPRTTRRNMLATELTESLRRHLLWERQQKSSTANAVLKRRHTSHDVANLKQYPEKPYMSKDEDANASSWNQDLFKDAFGGYHSKGW